MLMKLKLLPVGADPKVVDRMFALADVNSDGQISFDEFKRIFNPEC